MDTDDKRQQQSILKCEKVSRENNIKLQKWVKSGRKFDQIN